MCGCFSAEPVPSNWLYLAGTWERCLFGLLCGCLVTGTACTRHIKNATRDCLQSESVGSCILFPRSWRVTPRHAMQEAISALICSCQCIVHLFLFFVRHALIARVTQFSILPAVRGKVVWPFALVAFPSVNKCFNMGTTATYRCAPRQSAHKTKTLSLCFHNCSSWLGKSRMRFFHSEHFIALFMSAVCSPTQLRNFF